MVRASPDHQEVAALPPASVKLRRFSVEEYHRMTAAGVFAGDERFELLDGWVVAKMTRNPPRDVALGLCEDLLKTRLPADWHVRAQSAMTTEDSEPEPDVVICCGARRDYLEHHPGAREIALVVEIADSSLERDRHAKGAVYARAGIRTYWIINLQDRCVETYEDPSGPVAVPAFHRRRDYRSGELVPLSVNGSAVEPVAVDQLLP